MSPSSLTWQAELMPDKVLRLAFDGLSGVGSLGNVDGEFMQRVIEDAIAANDPAALLIDFSDLQYSFGDWMFGVPLPAARRLGAGRVCILAVGETATAMGSLWTLAQAASFAPLFQSRSDALAYLSSFRDRTDA
jgi:hypothetical protein